MEREKKKKNMLVGTIIIKLRMDWKYKYFDIRLDWSKRKLNAKAKHITNPLTHSIHWDGMFNLFVNC